MLKWLKCKLKYTSKRTKRYSATLTLILTIADSIQHLSEPEIEAYEAGGGKKEPAIIISSGHRIKRCNTAFKEI